MIGPQGAAARLTGWLDARLPARLRDLETRLGLPAASLPDPVLVVDHETGPLGVEDWPAVVVTPVRLETMTTVEQATDTDTEVYRCGYTVEVHLWVRADGYAATDRLRHRYVLAAREAILERKQLAAAPAYGAPSPSGPEFTVHPNQLREDYSPVITDAARRTIAGARLDVTVNVVETFTRTPLGTVETPPAVSVHPIEGAITETVTHPGLE